MCIQAFDVFKVVGIGTDGASVMTGKHNGTVKQIVDFQLQ